MLHRRRWFVETTTTGDRGAAIGCVDVGEDARRMPRRRRRRRRRRRLPRRAVPILSYPTLPSTMRRAGKFQSGRGSPPKRERTVGGFSSVRSRSPWFAVRHRRCQSTLGWRPPASGLTDAFSKGPRTADEPQEVAVPTTGSASDAGFDRAPSPFLEASPSPK
jgi:hypothetical protein